MSHIIVQPPKVKDLCPPPRLMLGPGPSNAHPKVYQAMALPQVGHLDPAFLQIAEETKDLIRYVWQTNNKFTVPVSATASAAWESCAANLIEPGETVLTFVTGYFGLRNLDICSRYGAKNESISKPDGEVFTFEEIKAGIEKYKPKMVHITHSETSTGAIQSIEGVGEVCRQNDCLLLLDVVTSTAGIPVYLDEWKVDAAYGGGQKNLACPPGISMLSFSDRALEKMKARKNPVPNWYLDMNMIAKYLIPEDGVAAPRVYHHTAPISMIYALREALRLVAEEGLENCWKRHAETAKELYKRMDEMNLKCLVKPEVRSPSLTTIVVPEGIDAAKVCKFMLDNYNIEIGTALGALKGKCWRLGLMGYNSNKANVLLVLSALKEALKDQGFKC